MLLQKGSKGNLVKVMQSLLKQIGFEIDIDGFYGSQTEALIRLFQEDALLNPVDGICGNQTYSKLIEISKMVTKNYKESIIWLEPKQIKLAIVNNTSSYLLTKYRSFVNGTFFWYDTKNKKNQAIGWLYSEGKCLQSNNIINPRGTLLILKSGEVICKVMTNAELMDYKKKDNIWFCIQGYKNPKNEGFNEQEVGRKCLRPIIGYSSKTNKILIAVFNGDWKLSEDIAKKYNLDGWVNLDAGGSTNFVVCKNKIFSTARQLQNIVWWD